MNRMNLLSLIALISTTACFSISTKAAGDVEMANCSGAVGTTLVTLRLYRSAQAPSTIKVDYTSGSIKRAVNADQFQFSTDRSTLQVIFSKFIFASIIKGKKTQGKMGVALGGTPTSLVCDANW